MPECKKCKKEIPENSKYCCFCGTLQGKIEKNKAKRGNGMGTAFKRGKTWTVQVAIDYKLNDKGRKIPIFRTKGGFKSYTEAILYVPTLLTTPKQEKSNKRFYAFFEDWQASYINEIKHETMLCYEAAIKYFKDIHHMKFVDVSPMDLQNCIDKCPRGKRTKENMKAVASLMYKYGLKLEIVDRNKTEALSVGHDETTSHPPITMEELERIKESKEPYASYIVALCYLGTRPNELFKVKKEDYDFEHECIITGSKTKAGIDRVITVSPKIQSIIRDQMKTPGPYLFPCLPSNRPNGAKGGEFMTVNHFAELFKETMSAIGIENRVPYSCRHTFSNLLKKVKGSDTDKASLMGHQNASMTKYYQEADYESLKEITDNI